MNSTEVQDHAGVITNNKRDRRSFLSKLTLAGLGLTLLNLPGKVMAQQGQKQPIQPEADSGHDYTMPTPNPKNEKEFRVGVFGPATLSLLTSEIAVDKTTDAAAKEFSNFELREAIGVTTILKNLHTPQPPMDAMAKATLDKIKSTGAGAEFDKTYIKAQLENHEFLRDLTVAYLRNTDGQTSMPEMQTRQLAILALGTFKEHVVHTKNILAALG